MSATYRIFSLVESCPTNQMDGANTGGGEMGAATKYVSGWLNANPGRWFLVGEMLNAKNHFIGLDARALGKFGYESRVVNNKVYARLAHASGVPLDDLVSRYKPAGRTEAMPTLERDKFNWSTSELRTALSTAREWLQGGESLATAA